LKSHSFTRIAKNANPDLQAALSKYP